MKRIIGSDPVIERAYDELSRFNWTDDELLIYEQESKRSLDNAAADAYLLEAAEARGKDEEKLIWLRRCC